VARKITPELRAALERVVAKRPKVVIDHILKHGYVTTEELTKTYGYDHPPRAARDVREQGIPLETFAVRGAHGRSIAAYRFGDLAKIQSGKLGGRKTFAKALKGKLYEQADGRCQCCSVRYEARYLQVDHRVPYEVAGDQKDADPLAQLMLLCASCQRSKSWSCEHCENWKTRKSISICESCFWAQPTSHTHVAMTPERRLEIVWVKEEVAAYDVLSKTAKDLGLSVADHAKVKLKECLTRPRTLPGVGRQ
jgi:hypothetical protein